MIVTKPKNCSKHPSRKHSSFLCLFFLQWQLEQGLCSHFWWAARGKKMGQENVVNFYPCMTFWLTIVELELRSLYEGKLLSPHHIQNMTYQTNKHTCRQTEDNFVSNTRLHCYVFLHVFTKWAPRLIQSISSNDHDCVYVSEHDPELHRLETSGCRAFL